MLSPFDNNDLTVFRGDDLAIQLTFQDTNKAPINITGWTIFMTIKNTKDDSDEDALVEFTSSTIPDPALGIFWIRISNTETVQLTGSYWYDIQVKKLDGTIQTVTGGNINFERDVTRRTS